MRHESRNTNVGIQGELLPMPDQAEQVALDRRRQLRRVGARRQGARARPMGGGSPSSCSALESGLQAAAPPRDALAGRDPRVEELRQMGLRPPWIAVADSIGFEPFIQFWQTLSANQDMLDGRNRVTMPSIQVYLRFLRNHLIRTLAASGASATAICESLKRDHGMAVEIGAVRWVMRKMRK